MKIYINKKRIYGYLIFIISIISIIGIAYQSKNGLIMQLVIGILLLFALGFFQWYICKKSFNKNVSMIIAAVLCIPTILSCFQNVIYGYFIEDISGRQLQIMLSLNLVIAGFSYIFFIFSNFRFQNILYKKIILLLIATVGYSTLVWWIFQGDIVSSISSLRNIITPFLMILIGIIAGKYTKSQDYAKYIVFIGTLIVLFGYYELYIGTDFWLEFNITELWLKKGIIVNYFGIPSNFYSSEFIGGSVVRRMVSTYADPVNLGAFLFATFVMAFRYKYKFLSVFIFMGSILVISKGALLGYLILCVIWSYYKKGYKVFIPVLLITTCCGLGFLIYTSYNSTGSVFLHINGFFMAFNELLYHPLGQGLGNVGVLAGLFSTGSQSEITESGLGMIIGQLGVIGLLIYTIFWILLVKNIMNINDLDDKYTAMTLLISIILNIFFNEVALSPNSCTVYYVMIGLILGNKMEYKKELYET